ncbi:hypothetical protein Tco_1029922 [Tanacetum coccineum]|uniref:Uncharacterized protein n=1 Tax=Tanacetum coccineum TaxID=301880 RepID=A0ABQ5G4T1_9ASTR
MPMDDLLQAVPKLISRIDSLEMDLKQTKLTMGNAIVKLVKKVKKLEGNDPLDSSVSRTGLLSYNKVRHYRGGTSGRNKEEKRLKVRKVSSSLELSEEVYDLLNRSKLRVNTGSIKLSTGDEQLSTGDEQVSAVDAEKPTSDQDKGQREGKAPMISEETPKKTKEQILQEEASLAEAIRLDTEQREEVARQVHLDSLLAQRIAEEEELNEQQKKRKAQVQFEAQHYTN